MTVRGIRIVVVAAIVALLATALSGTAVADAQAQTQEGAAVEADVPASTTIHTLIEEGDVEGSSLQIDSEGRPVVVYRIALDSGENVIKLAQCGTPRCEGLLVRRLMTTQPLQDLTLLLDDSDHPVIGYVDDDLVTVARCADPLCESMRVQTVEVGRNADFALDADGKVVVAYTRAELDRNSLAWVLDVSRCVDTECISVSTERLDAAQRPYEYHPELQIDSDDHPVILYRELSAEVVPDYGRPAQGALVRCLDARCGSTTRALLSEPGPFMTPQMRLDASDRPIVIAATDWYDGSLSILACGDRDCSTVQANRLRNGVYESVRGFQLALTPEGLPVYAPNLEGDGDYFPEVFTCLDRICSDAETSGQIGGTSVGARGLNAMVLDLLGHPVVLYGRGSFKIATCGSPLCSNTSVTPYLGHFYVQNVRTGRYLDADGDGGVDTSEKPTSDDVWEFSARYVYRTLRNVDTGLFLTPNFTTGDVTLEDTDRPSTWRVGQAGYDKVVIVDAARDYLTHAADNSIEVQSVADEGRAMWRLVPVEAADPDPLAGSRIALQSLATNRWLDNDADGSVNQSLNQRADDEWDVIDAGDGYVYLQNAATGRYLDADEGNLDVDSSTALVNDKRWELRRAGDHIYIRNARFGGYLTAENVSAGGNVIRQDELFDATYWTPVITG